MSDITEKQQQNTPNCLKCNSSFVYKDGNLFVCPECGYEFSNDDAENNNAKNAGFVVKDVNGAILQDGDSISVIKDLKLKGSSTVVKVGTKVKSIRLVDSDHNIDCKIDGIGKMALKSEFVKKV
jgi:protein PhnA